MDKTRASWRLVRALCKIYIQNKAKTLYSLEIRHGFSVVANAPMSDNFCRNMHTNQALGKVIPVKVVTKFINTSSKLLKIW